MPEDTSHPKVSAQVDAGGRFHHLPQIGTDKGVDATFGIVQCAVLEVGKIERPLVMLLTC